MNLSFLWALAFEYPVINSPFSLKRNYSFLHPHGGVYCREARPSQCRQNWLSQFSDFAKHCLIEYDENSYTCTCFLSSQCPRKIVTLGWLRFLEGLAKHLDICYLAWGEELGWCAQIWATSDYPGYASVLFLLDHVVPVGHVHPARLLFSLVAYSPHQQILFWNFEILYIVKVHFIFTNAAKCKQTNCNWKYCPAFHLIWPFMANMSRENIYLIVFSIFVFLYFCTSPLLLQCILYHTLGVVS